MTKQRIKVLDKEFEIFISYEKIAENICKIADKINSELKDKNPLFIGILNGSFMFAGDLFKLIKIDCNITFLKIASYSGTSSTGKVKKLIGINEDIRNRIVVILEDIVDTGITIENIKKQLIGYEPAEIKICTLLFKPDAYIKNHKIDYCGIEIPNEFVVGYGLDYNGYGRNYKNIYKIIK